MARKSGRSSKPPPKAPAKPRTRAKQTKSARSEPARDAARPQVLGAVVRDDSWLRRIRRNVALQPGATTNSPLTVPAADAQRVLRSTVRLVADLPGGAASDVVWVNGDSELVVHTAAVTLACDPGVVTVGLPVSCDQLSSAVVTVSLAVGTQDAPCGLLMATFGAPQGPAVVLDVWAEALTAFAWEAVLHLAQLLSGEVGRDASGLPLVPAIIGAAQGALLVQPMARHAVIGGST